MNDIKEDAQKQILTLSSLGHTWILDLDGTLVEHNGYKIYGEDKWLSGALEFLKSIPAGDMIVFLTSRKAEFADVTEAFLKKYGIVWEHIIYEAPYGERILLNDRKPSGLQMAYAINEDRNQMIDLALITDHSL